MFRRSKRPDVDALRTKFVDNLEKVRSFVDGWDIPEVEWPEVDAVPLPWAVPRRDERSWLEQQAPLLNEYWWLLEARPVAEGVSQVVATWQFGEGHEFDHLNIEIRSVADPEYLAEKLALGVHAAALRGWQGAEDLQDLHAWLLEGIGSEPLGEMLRGQQRTGFILFSLTRVPLSRTQLAVRLHMTLTGTALDGTPLDDAGEVPPA